MVAVRGRQEEMVGAGVDSSISLIINIDLEDVEKAEVVEEVEEDAVVEEEEG